MRTDARSRRPRHFAVWLSVVAVAAVVAGVLVVMAGEGPETVVTDTPPATTPAPDPSPTTTAIDSTVVTAPDRTTATVESPPVEAATFPGLDLAGASIMGLAAPTDGPSDDTIAAISEQLGAPTFDSGWYVSAEEDVGDGLEDCFGGLEERLVQWGNLHIGFMRLGEPSAPSDRLVALTVGDPTDIVDLMRVNEPVPTVEQPLIVTAEGFGAGSSLASLVGTGAPITMFDANATEVEDPAQATQAFVYLAAGRTMAIDLGADGTVRAIKSIDTGFC